MPEIINARLIFFLIDTTSKLFKSEISVTAGIYGNYDGLGETSTLPI